MSVSRCESTRVLFLFSFYECAIADYELAL